MAGRFRKPQKAAQQFPSHLEEWHPPEGLVHCIESATDLSLPAVTQDSISLGWAATTLGSGTKSNKPGAVVLLLLLLLGGDFQVALLEQ